MSTELAVLVVAVMATLTVVVLAIVIVRGRSHGGGDVKASALEALKLTLANQEGNLDARVSELDSKLASLQTTVASREAALNEQVLDLGRQMRGIAGLFNNDRARGGWGEISMLRVFEMGGLVEGRDYTAQFHAGERTPDAVVHLPGGRNIVIDSKFPVARYNEALAVEDAEEHLRLLVEQSRELERVGKALIDRGYAEIAAGGYVVMYLPSQAVYEAAAEAAPQVIDRLLAKRVVVAGPTALYALMMNVASLMTEHRGLQQADQILDEARELQKRMVVFVDHLRGVGTALARTVAAFNGAVGSWTSRVAPQLDRVNDLHNQARHEPFDPIDEAVRNSDLTEMSLAAGPPAN